MKRIRLSVSLYSGAGSTRKLDQDNFYINGRTLSDPHREESFYLSDVRGGVFAVADGMGGEHDGEAASREAVGALSGLNERSVPTVRELKRRIELANERISANAEKSGGRTGSTVVIAAVRKNLLTVCNVGDSKCFLYSGGRLKMLSKDHTVTAQMVEAGIITQKQASKDRRRHQLFQHLGIPAEEMSLSIHESCETALYYGDVILLCSDGITDGLSEDEIAAIIGADTDGKRLAEKLAVKAMENGSTDNVTAMTLMVSKPKGLFG